MPLRSFRAAGAALCAAALLALSGCLPGQLGDALSKANSQNKAISRLAKDVKKALRKKKLDPAEASQSYGAYVSALAQFSELMIQASTSDKEPKNGAAAAAAVGSARDAFLALAKDVLVKTGRESSLKGLPAFDAGASQAWSAYMALSAAARESNIEAITSKLTMPAWDDL